MKALIKKSMEELNEHKQVGKQVITNYSHTERFSCRHIGDILCRTREESSPRLSDRRLLGRDHRVCHQEWRAGSCLGCYRANYWLHEELKTRDSTAPWSQFQRARTLLSCLQVLLQGQGRRGSDQVHGTCNASRLSEWAGSLRGESLPRHAAERLRFFQSESHPVALLGREGAWWLTVTNSQFRRVSHRSCRPGWVRYGQPNGQPRL